MDQVFIGHEFSYRGVDCGKYQETAIMCGYSRGQHVDATIQDSSSYESYVKPNM